MSHLVDSSLLARAIDTAEGYLQLANQVTRTKHATFVTNDQWPGVNDANHCALVRFTEGDDAAMDAVLSAIHGRDGGSTVKVDPLTPPEFEARLVLEGRHPHTELHMMLPAAANIAAPSSTPADIRPVRTEDDWAVLARLKRLDYIEAAELAGRAMRSEADSWALINSKRAKSPDVRYFLAAVDGEDCAFFSAWPGTVDLGVVEDLYTLSPYRRRGIASALFAHAVSDARGRGASEVMTSADPDDTPKHLFAALGFIPLFLLRSYSPAPPTEG
ncbi:MAG: GNAT family N-acetyltransferase [Pseudonocardiaceae bacterium]